MHAQSIHWGASGTRMLQHSEMAIPFILLWLHFFVNVHNCVHVIEYYIIIVVIIIANGITHYLYV